MHPLWSPSLESQENSLTKRFMKTLGIHPHTIHELYDWSIESPEKFWKAVYDFCEIKGNFQDPIFEPSTTFEHAKWFPRTTLNFAENLLKRQDDHLALVFKGEEQVLKTYSFKELYDHVSQARQAFQDLGLKQGDVVAALMPNSAETVIAMLAATSLGAIWTSCSPDFGNEAILDRFGQVDPKILIGIDCYFYGGKRFECLDKLAFLKQGLTSLKAMIVVPYLKETASKEGLIWTDILQNYTPKRIEFEKFPFRYPLYIVYSSGTTGLPKCIIHSAGGVLIQHLKEHQLHLNVKPDDVLFYFTTCGWMMWHWLASGLASGATLMLYDGSPFYPHSNILWDYAEQYKCTHFGTSAKYIDALRKSKIHLLNTHPLPSLKYILSTGSPLIAENFHYVYENLKQDVCLASISGGTDILSCFVSGSPLLSVYEGQCQMRGLGMKVEVFDEQGHSLHGEKGELVCTKSFPSQPLGFWNDDTQEKYHNAYFSKYKNVWCHGDYVMLTKEKGMIIYGRSDTVINPSGVRIGTAEIYRQVEVFDEIVESLVVGHMLEGDERVILFVRLKEGFDLTDDLMNRIKKRLKDKASPRHVPYKIISVPDIPKTKNNKIAELTVKDILNGKTIQNETALQNPECLAYFQALKVDLQ
jgi:acetoacetyl-CoA synthetase